MKKLLSTLLICLLTVSFIGCGPKPEASLKAFFDSTKAADFKTMSKYIKTSDTDKITAGKFDTPEEEKVVKAILKNIDYEIISTTVEKDTATAKVKITATDMVKVYTEAIKQVISDLLPKSLDGKKPSDEEVKKMTMDYLLKAITDPKASKVTNEVEIKMTKEKDNWIITPSDDLSNAITGNLLKATSK